MMAIALNFALICFGLALLCNLYRIINAPGVGDRVLALDTMVINAIGLIVLLGIAQGIDAAAAAQDAGVPVLVASHGEIAPDRLPGVQVLQGDAQDGEAECGSASPDEPPGEHTAHRDEADSRQAADQGDHTEGPGPLLWWRT